MLEWWAVLIIALGSAIAGGFIGFFITRIIVQKQLEKNPPITADQIRAMYRQMGRKASESDIRKVLNSMKRAKK